MAKHFEDLREVVQNFNDDDSAAVATSKRLLEQPANHLNAVFITNNFGCLIRAITSLEKQHVELHEALEVVRKAEMDLEKVAGETGIAASVKLKNVVGKNVGLAALRQISKILSDPNYKEGLQLQDCELNVSDAIYFKYAPITSCDVERSFSRYKHVLSDKRLSLTMENVKYLMVTQCNV